MEYKVQVYQVEGKENLLGFANLVLEGQFVLNGFAIKEFRNGKVYSTCLTRIFSYSKSCSPPPRWRRRLTLFW